MMLARISDAHDRGRPDWRRHASAAKASALGGGAKDVTMEGRGWLLLDIGIVVGFALLCVATGILLS